MGSSPLTRGKQLQQSAGCLHGGLIPAHAGKTARAPVISSAQAAHPRSRGENVIFHLKGMQLRGSSPLTRGKRMRDNTSCAYAGLIPAHAGKTELRPIPVRAEWAHPRSRGENSRPRGKVLRPAGSSPLTRGKLVGRGVVGAGGGLIPAHAGKTQHRQVGKDARRAHPRSRGENTS